MSGKLSSSTRFDPQPIIRWIPYHTDNHTLFPGLQPADPKLNTKVNQYHAYLILLIMPKIGYNKIVSIIRN
jgi:hypothetical protein